MAIESSWVFPSKNDDFPQLWLCLPVEWSPLEVCRLGFLPPETEMIGCYGAHRVARPSTLSPVDSILLLKITFLRVIPTMTCQDMSGHIFGHILNIFWHSIWRIFWLSIWQSIWHIFWPSTWLGIRHSIWHSFEFSRFSFTFRFVLVSTKHRMHKADAYTSGISQRLVGSIFVESFCQGTLPN